MNPSKLNLISPLPGKIAFVSSHEEPYGAFIKHLATSCLQPFSYRARGANGGLTNSSWFEPHMSSAQVPFSLVLCFSPDPLIIREAKATGVPVFGCYSKNPKEAVLAAAYFASLIRARVCIDCDTNSSV